MLLLLLVVVYVWLFGWLVDVWFLFCIVLFWFGLLFLFASFLGFLVVVCLFACFCFVCLLVPERNCNMHDDLEDLSALEKVHGALRRF